MTLSRACQPMGVQLSFESCLSIGLEAWRAANHCSITGPGATEGWNDIGTCITFCLLPYASFKYLVHADDENDLKYYRNSSKNDKSKCSLPWYYSHCAQVFWVLAIDDLIELDLATDKYIFPKLLVAKQNLIWAKVISESIILVYQYFMIFRKILKSWLIYLMMLST